MKTDETKIIDPELTYKIIGILYKIHNKLGPLYQEKYYQRAIDKELADNKINFSREVAVDIKYNDCKIGFYKVDFLIENKVLLETKTVPRIIPKYINQLLSYMNTLQIQIGLIANFKNERLYIKRLLLADKHLIKSVIHPFKSERLIEKSG